MHVSLCEAIERDPVIAELVELGKRKDLEIIIKPFRSRAKGLLKGNKIGIREGMNIEEMKYTLAHNLLDFNDLEANALELLEPKYGIVTLLYQQLKEIMIDEYQDTNQIQETLINKIADLHEPKINRFMVGDMKQSIYRFREADPEIFNEKYLTFNLLPKTKRIDLKFNYRSNKIVLDSVNYIFNQIIIQFGTFI